MFMSIIYSIVQFLVSALALKLAIDVVGTQGVSNKYSKALAVAGGIGLAKLLLGFIPLVGYFLYLGLWVFIIRDTYNLSIKKSVGVGLLQIAIGWLILWALKFVGLIGPSVGFFG
ncbi:MAG: hypothetical protein AAGI01_00755 [Myxococcota bacterium]